MFLNNAWLQNVKNFCVGHKKRLHKYSLLLHYYTFMYTYYYYMVDSCQYSYLSIYIIIPYV